MTDAVDPELIAHLARTTGLPAGTCRRIALDVLAQHADTVEAYVRRRHAELKAQRGMKNEQIYTCLAEELKQRRFAAPDLTERQIRRMIYG